MQGLRTGKIFHAIHFSNNACILLDNIEIARKLGTNSLSISSQFSILEFMEETKKSKILKPLPHTLEVLINIRWVPEHEKIVANELVDFEAKRWANLPYADLPKCSPLMLEQWLFLQKS